MNRIKRRQLLTMLPRIITFLGLSIVAVCLSIEAVKFPWEIYFDREEDLNTRILDAPAPVHFDYGDDDIVIISPQELAENPELYNIEQDQAGEINELPANAKPAVSAQKLYVRLGALKIPKLNISINIFEGSNKQMWYGAGHISGTALPGNKGNSAIISHRARYFRYLDLLGAGDTVQVIDDSHTYKYTVYESFDVLPEEVGVLGRVEGEQYVLTLITCTPYPIYSHRLIVRCRLSEIDGQPFVPAKAGEGAPANGETENPETQEPGGKVSEGFGTADYFENSGSDQDNQSGQSIEDAFSGLLEPKGE